MQLLLKYKEMLAFKKNMFKIKLNIYLKERESNFQILCIKFYRIKYLENFDP